MVVSPGGRFNLARALACESCLALDFPNLFAMSLNWGMVR